MYVKHFVPLLWTGILILVGGITSIEAEPLPRSEAIRLALERNPEVVAARKEWDAARARVSQARALPDPELELEFEELPGGFSLGQFGERNIGATQTIEFPMKWWLRGRAAGQDADAARMSAFEMAKLEVATQVKIVYDRVLVNQQLLDYAEQNLKLAEDFLKKSRVRLEAGDVPQLEVLRAEVEAGRAQNRVTLARNELSVSKAELNALLARDIRAPLEMAGELAYRPIDVSLEQLKDLALKRRPDLMGAGLTVAGARSLRSATVSSMLPDLNLGVFRQTIRGPAGQENAWRVSFGLEVPLWGMFRQRGEIAEASAEVAHAVAKEDAIRYQVRLEVESAFLDLKATEEQVQLFRNRIVREAERAYEVANRSYEEGKATYLELLEARRALTETRVEYAETLFNYHSARSALERSAGGDLSE